MLINKLVRKLQIVAAMLLSLTLSSFAYSSVYYSFDLVAIPGEASLTGMGDSPSINDNGTVAFVGQLSGGESIFVGNGSAAPRNINPGFVGLTRGFGRAVQINNSNKVVARELLTGSPPRTLIRIWDANANSLANSFVTIVRGGGGSDLYNAVLNQPSINNVNTKLENVSAPGGNDDGVCDDPQVESCIDQVAFLALLGGSSVLATPIKTPISTTAPGLYNDAALTSPLSPMIADDGRVVVRMGSASTNSIKVFDNNLGSVITIAAASMGFTNLGLKPGISDDGRIVAFSGDIDAVSAGALGTTAGPGIFACIFENTAGNCVIKRITGGQVSQVNGNPAADLGYDEAGIPRYFLPGSYDINNRIAVINQDFGSPGIDDNTFVICFIATPNAASRANPMKPDTPLLFSKEQGIWTVRIDVERELGGILHPRVYNITNPIPVVQINDDIGGGKVSKLVIHDPIANAAFDETGLNIRTQRRGDHRVAFWAQTSIGPVIIRASHLDSDQDGLLDHWETNGIDINQDGTRDLDLASMGANPKKRDIFIEIDWLSNQPNFKHEPQAGVINAQGGQASDLVRMFRDDAFELTGRQYGIRSDGGEPEPIEKGIVLHIDGGAGKDNEGRGWSINMGNTLLKDLQGGDLIGTSTNKNTWVPVVYMGFPGSGSVNVPGIETRAFSDIKDHYFGTNSLGARELAFKYVVFGSYKGFIEESQGVPYKGIITSACNTCPTSPPQSAQSQLISDSSVPLGLKPGNIVIITSQVGFLEAREIVKVDVSDPNKELLWLDRPWSDPQKMIGSAFHIINASSGEAEAKFQSETNNHGIPGNDLLVSLGGFQIGKGILGNACQQWRTLAHELGHTLGLRHGGTDHEENKGAIYKSLMSYSYQLDCDNKSSVVNSYSTGDITYNDFANLRHDFQNSLIHIGNSGGISFGDTALKHEPELSRYEAELLYGPLDMTVPVIAINSPTDGATVSVGSNLTINITASDDRSLDSVFAEFDIDGDGNLEGPGESVPAINIGGNVFQATFNNITVPNGMRKIQALAIDSSSNRNNVVISIVVSSETAQVATPNVVGQTQASAQAAIVAAGLTVGTVTQQSSSSVPSGSVISQNPVAATNVAVGSAVLLTVSSGPAQVATPNVVGQTQASAQAAIVAAGLTVGAVTQQSSSSVPSGSVISQNPAAATNVAAGSAVLLVVSSGTACSLSVDDHITITRGGFQLNRITKRYVQQVTVKNTSNAPILGPVSLALDGLSSNSTLFNAIGSTICALPVSPYVSVNVGPDNVFSIGESVIILLEFVNPTNQGINYSTRVLSGSPQ